MVKVPTDTIARLQADPSCIRNICVLAHVDHGKTSLTDCLLASNGIISQKLAGTVRYLDARPDEQLRGITMESSAISLYFRTVKRPEKPEEDPIVKEHLVNLIDSPGHIDFSYEVSAASRLCDGSVVLVDVVEGVCSQTVTVLRQAWVEKVSPVLVLNKMDRLYTELQLTPLEAYQHLSRVIEQVNSILGSFFVGERMEDDYKWREQLEKLQLNDTAPTFQEKDDEHLYFAPEKNNVVFASAVEGWGFTIGQFAALYEKKSGMKRQVLNQTLWGDFYFDAKSKKVLTPKTLKGRNLKPMFVSFILDSIWALYRHVDSRAPEKLAAVAQSLELPVAPRELRAKDARSVFLSVIRTWLPLASAVLLTVVEHVPSPLEAQQRRIPMLIEAAPHGDRIDPRLRQAMLNCDAAGPVAAYVSKMVAVPAADLPTEQQELSEAEQREKARLARIAAVKAIQEAEEARRRAEERKADPFGFAEPEEEAEETEDSATDSTPQAEQEVLIGFARVYAGTLRVGQKVSVLQPKFDPATPEEHVQSAEISHLYLLMGKELVAVSSVPAGNVVGIAGLGSALVKNGTIIEPGITGVNLAGVSRDSPPLVRVAVESVDPTQMDQLVEGLRVLNYADPCVEISIQETGEHILAAAGELHLERCLNDLRDRFARVEIQVSEPVVPFRETFIDGGDAAASGRDAGQPRGAVAVQAGGTKLMVHVVPLPMAVTEYLVAQEAQIRSGSEAQLKQIKEKLAEVFAEFEANSRKEWPFQGGKVAQQLTAFGPKRVGPNLLISDGNSRYDTTIRNAFQLAVAKGPICEEPVQGVAVLVEELREKSAEAEAEAEVETGKAEEAGVEGSTEESAEDPTDEPTEAAGAGGKLLGALRTSMHRGMMEWSPRIMLAQYSCDIQATAEVLGKVYGVVTKRRGKIVSEEMKEGTPFFNVNAKIPVVEAFGFAEEIRKRTSGAAQPQLVFSGFEVLDEDPYWVPTTEEELEELGQFAERENIARKYMNAIRSRRGLFVEQKLVENAEKQRTLKR